MLKRLVIIIVFSFPVLNFSQDFSEFWEGHFSYLNIIEIVDATNKVYAAAENAVFSYDPSTSQLETITTLNGLSGELITAIHYSSDYQLLLIGYQNGLIEIFKESENAVLKVIDIVNKTTIPPNNKNINHFNELNGLVYIATDYGVSTYDLENLEFGDTYYIGFNGSQAPVSQTVIKNNEIYANCGGNGGIKSASVNNPNLIDFQQWTTIVTGNFANLIANDTNLIVTSTNAVTSKINANNSLTQLFVSATLPEDLYFSDEFLIETLSTKVNFYDTNFNLAHTIVPTTEFPATYSCTITLGNHIFIGTSSNPTTGRSGFGVLKTILTNSDTFEEIHPDGPLLNTPFSLELRNNELWLVFGGYGLFFEWNGGQRSSGISRYRQNEWLNITYGSISSEVVSPDFLSHISINPFDTEQVFVSSYYSGLIEVNNEEIVNIYNENNSSLEPFAPQRYLTSASKFDDNGVLWVANGRVEKPLNKFENNQWTSYDFTPIIPEVIGGELGFSDIVIGSDGTKWIGGYRSGLIGFNEDRMLLKNINDKDVANLPSAAVKALALDKNNVLWIGTYGGLRVLYNTSSFFTEEIVRTEPIIILEEGLPQELLAQQFISDIIVDGSNNKWISTADAGVFYVSSDGQKTIHHFTKDNSPLPSNGVNAMALDSQNGIVYFGTTRGLVAFKTGGSSTSESLEEIYVYPNPVRPGFNMAEDKIKIKNISENVNIKITDIEGNLVAEAQSNVNLRYKNYNLEIDGGTAYWNGKNLANNTVASGVYLVLFSDFDTFETKVSKIMIIR
ncbi:ABC transporter substrate-binding protein [Flavobacteriaceae bacterium]|nr:ABC transporter substrate-binding protein [Flavobacteriaceae bacterium]